MRSTGVGSRAARLVARSPLTVGLLVVLWVVGGVSGSLLSGPRPALLDLVGAGLGPVSAGRWWVLLTAPLWSSGLPGYLWSTVVVAGGVGLAERVLGSLRAGTLALVVQVLGTLLGLGLVALVAASGVRSCGTRLRWGRRRWPSGARWA